MLEVRIFGGDFNEIIYLYGKLELTFYRDSTYHWYLHNYEMGNDKYLDTEKVAELLRTWKKHDNS